MLICPTCNIPLKTVQGTPGVFWQCPSCGGRSATISLLRRHIPADIINKLWQSAKSGTFPRKRICPGCGKHMAEIPTAAEGKPCLDICTLCQVVWFDRGEYATLPTLQKQSEPKDTLSQEAREKIALMEIEIAREEARKRDIGSYTPESPWEWVAGILGMPIEQDAKSIRSAPLVTCCMAAAITIISVYAFVALPTSVKDFGLIPAHPERYGGLTFLTSFLLHGSALHLLGNLYFLLIFGDNVEDWLGRWRFILLIVCATLVGDVAHIMGNASSNTPCIGASGGISGVIAFYALKFPHVRLGFLMRFYLYFRWISLPVYVFFLFWVLIQFVGIWTQLSGFSNVAALAHLGGAGVGLVFWLATRKDFELRRKGAKNQEMLDAMAEAKRLSRAPHAKRYTDVDDLVADDLK